MQQPLTAEAIEELERQVQQAQRRLEKLTDDYMAQTRRYESNFKVQQTEVKRLERRLDNLRQALRVQRVGQGLSAEDPRLRYRGMTVKEVLVDLARAQGGLLVARDACEVLVEARFTATAEQAANSVHAVLCKFQGEIFERVRRGVYRLLEPAAQKGGPRGARSSAG